MADRSHHGSAPNDVVDFEYRTREGSYIPIMWRRLGNVPRRSCACFSRKQVVHSSSTNPRMTWTTGSSTRSRRRWTAKQNRQLIFASHNANLVVNGDADLICAFDYGVSGEQTAREIACEGAIDDPPVREAVTTVMEGDKSAFVLRRDKYGF